MMSFVRRAPASYGQANASTRRSMRVALVAGAFVLGVVASPIAGFGAGTTIASDAVGRTLSATLGKADVGATYYYAGPAAAFAVHGGGGTMKLGAGGRN